jgi:DNA-directed RNA polymerase specialized sigma24 family protein
MTQAQLLKHLQFCRWGWNGYGEDIFQEACLIALERYKSLDKVNSSLFKLLYREAARKLLRHRKCEITFSQQQNTFFNAEEEEEEEEESFEDSLADPRSFEPFWDVLSDTNDNIEDNTDEAQDVNFVSFSDKKPLLQLFLPFVNQINQKINQRRC